MNIFTNYYNNKETYLHQNIVTLTKKFLNNLML